MGLLDKLLPENELIFVPVGVLNSGKNRIDNSLDFSFLFSEGETNSKKTGFYRKYLKGLTLSEYMKQGELINDEGTFYRRETDSSIEKFVLFNLRIPFEKKYNDGFTVYAKKDFISLRKEFYENAPKNLPVLNCVVSKQGEIFTQAHEGLVNMAKYLRESSIDDKLDAISDVAISLRKFHDEKYIFGDPTTMAVEYLPSERKSFFTNLRNAKKSDKKTDFGRDFSQLIISCCYNSGLNVNQVTKVFFDNYFNNDLKQTKEMYESLNEVNHYDDRIRDKKINIFSRYVRNKFSEKIFGYSWDVVIDMKKDIFINLMHYRKNQI